MDNFQNAANQVLDRCHSTNDIAKKLAEHGYPHGTWVSARVQESGRGRLGRKWESPEGNLFLSVVLRIPDKSRWSWVPLAIAVAAVRGLRGLFPELEIQIKWPNDLWLGGAKLGGILCEGSGSFIVAGLGLNCVESPKGLNRKIIDLSSAREGILTPADRVRLPILNTLLEEIQELSLNGPQQLKTLYHLWTVLPEGTEIEWESGIGNSIYYGVVKELGSAGELKVITRNGVVLSLFAEDVKIRTAVYSESIR